MKKIFLIIAIIIAFNLRSEIITYNKVLKNLKGVKKYQQKEFSEADEHFENNSLNNPDDGSLHYNRGTTLYKKGEFENAENEFKMSLRDKKFNKRSETFQNLGNIKFQNKEYKDAIKYFRQSLIDDAENEDARYNYELASRFLQQQQQQKQNQDQNQDDKDKEKQDQQEKQNQQDKQDKQEDQQDKKENQQQENQDKQNKKDEQQQEKQQQESKEEKQKKDDAEKILKALMQKEKEEMKKQNQKKLQGVKPKSGKYW